MEKSKNKFGIISVDELLKNKIQINNEKKQISIPTYQRPYKWNSKSVIDLLEDINNAIFENENRKENEEVIKYRIGTIILHDNDKTYDIVDGQQRTITLALIKYYIENGFINNDSKSAIFLQNFDNRVAQLNIYKNYNTIKSWFSANITDNKIQKEKFKLAFKEILEVVIIIVGKPSEAFQLFDSQNTRGKSLEPHDLLKAYHLREMKEKPDEMKKVVKEWENRKSKEISEIFKWYLYPIKKWSKWQRCFDFTDKDIDEFKGIQKNSSYTYAKRALKASPYFQINEAFTAGKDFFKLVEQYCNEKNEIKHIVCNEKKFEYIKNVFLKYDSIGLTYVENMFYCTLMCYYDRFGNLDENEVKVIFLWAVTLRLDLINVGYDSINKYVVGEKNDRYTNEIDMITRIYNARVHTDILNIQINLPDEKWVETRNRKWIKNKFYETIKEIKEGDNYIE